MKEELEKAYRRDDKQAVRRLSGINHDREVAEFGQHSGAVECISSNGLQLAERVCTRALGKSEV